MRGERRRKHRQQATDRRSPGGVADRQQACRAGRVDPRLALDDVRHPLERGGRRERPLAGAPAQDDGPPGGRLRAQLVEQTGLAVPGRALEQDRPARPPPDTRWSSSISRASSRSRPTRGGRAWRSASCARPAAGVPAPSLRRSAAAVLAPAIAASASLGPAGRSSGSISSIRMISASTPPRAPGVARAAAPADRSAGGAAARPRSGLRGPGFPSGTRGGSARPSRGRPVRRPVDPARRLARVPRRPRPAGVRRPRPGSRRRSRSARPTSVAERTRPSGLTITFDGRISRRPSPFSWAAATARRRSLASSSVGSMPSPAAPSRWSSGTPWTNGVTITNQAPSRPA